MTVGEEEEEDLEGVSNLNKSLTRNESRPNKRAGALANWAPAPGGDYMASKWLIRSRRRPRRRPRGISARLLGGEISPKPIVLSGWKHNVEFSNKRHLVPVSPRGIFCPKNFGVSEAKD